MAVSTYHRAIDKTPQYIARRRPIVRHSQQRGPVRLSPKKIEKSQWVSKKIKELTRMIYQIYHCPQQRDTLEILLDERRNLGKELVDLEVKINNEYEKRLKKYQFEQQLRKERAIELEMEKIAKAKADAARKESLIKAIEYGDRYAIMRAQDFGLDQVVKYWSSMNNFQISNRMLMVKHRQLEIYQNDPEFLVIKQLASVGGGMGEIEEGRDSEGATEQGDAAENQAKEEMTSAYL